MTTKRRAAAPRTVEAAAAPTVQAAAAPAGEVAKGEQAAKASARVIKVAAVSAQGRWRIGRFFTREVTEIDAGELSGEELERLVGDPQLIVDLGEASAE